MIVAGSVEAIALCSDCRTVLAALVRTEDGRRYLTRKRPTLASPDVEATSSDTLRVRCPCKGSERPYRGSRAHVITLAALAAAADRRVGKRPAALRLDPQPMLLSAPRKRQRDVPNSRPTA